MIRWLKQQYKYATEGFTTSATRRLLTLDVFSGQKPNEVQFILLESLVFNYLTLIIYLQVKNTFCDLNITTSFILSSCTGYVQALDVAINKPLKDRIGKLADISYDKNFTKWEKGSYTVGDRRIMLTKWVGQA